MALVSPAGVYCRIHKIEILPGDRCVVRWTLYPSAQSRQDGPGEFEATREGTHRGAEVTEFMQAEGDPQKTVIDNAIAAGYGALKALEQFEGWQDA
ncbi:MAG TPA: hypothetical protein VIG24_13265 [Acidimicrobiia bacterium]